MEQRVKEVKMEWLRLFNFILVFLAGFLSCLLIGFLYGGVEMPFGFSNSSIDAPGDWIEQSQIHVYENAIVIDIDKASLAKYAATGSMLPVLNEDSNGIRIVPENAEQIKVGDIISFENNADGDLIVHRVIEKGQDSEGIYFITKGDNNGVFDGKIRFKDIKYVTIGVLW